MEEAKKFSQTFPDPPAYYKQFDQTSEALQPPDLKLLKSKDYQLLYFGKQTQIPLEFEDQDIEAYGLQKLANFEAKDVKQELRVLFQRIHLGYMDYISFMTEEKTCQQQQIQDSVLQKSSMIDQLVMNSAYFLNKLRRKQALILLKKELTDAIENRDKLSQEMEGQIEESQKRFKQGMAEDGFEQELQMFDSL